MFYFFTCSLLTSSVMLSFTFLTAMWNFQRFEFKRHWLRTSMFLILISMCAILLVEFYWVSLVAVSIVQTDLSYFNLQKDQVNLLTIF